jgi:opacity protein-like surface antigen
MTPRFVVATMTVLALAWPASASAQERSFGVTMGFPTAIGVFWKVAERVAVRPEFNFSKTKVDDEPTTWSVGTGVSGLFYLKPDEPLRPYVASRFTYARQNLEDPGFFSFESATDIYSLSALFGAQYLLGDRFLVYGEVGIRGAYSSSNDTVTGPTVSFSDEPTGYSLGTTGGVGIALLF